VSAATWHRVAAASVEAERAALRAVSEVFEALRNKLATIALTEDESEDDTDD
jgi:ribosomal protein L10